MLLQTSKAITWGTLPRTVARDVASYVSYQTYGRWRIQSFVTSDVILRQYKSSCTPHPGESFCISGCRRLKHPTSQYSHHKLSPDSSTVSKLNLWALVVYSVIVILPSRLNLPEPHSLECCPGEWLDSLHLCTRARPTTLGEAGWARPIEKWYSVDNWSCRNLQTWPEQTTEILFQYVSCGPSCVTNRNCPTVFPVAGCRPWEFWVRLLAAATYATKVVNTGWLVQSSIQKSSYSYSSTSSLVHFLIFLLSFSVRGQWRVKLSISTVSIKQLAHSDLCDNSIAPF